MAEVLGGVLGLAGSRGSGRDGGSSFGVTPWAQQLTVLLPFLLCPRRALDMDWRHQRWPWLQLWGHVCALPLSHQHRGAAWCLVSAKGVCPCLLGCPQALCPTSGSLVPCQLSAASSACCAQATLRPVCVCLGGGCECEGVPGVWGGLLFSVGCCFSLLYLWFGAAAILFWFCFFCCG